MTAVEVSLNARQSLHRLIESRELPPTALERTREFLSALELFPRGGSQIQLEGRALRYLVGPWSWLLIVYIYDETADRVTVVSFEDSREANSATSISR